MIHPKDFFSALNCRDVGFYVGVPDSLLANFCSYVDDNGGEKQHLIAANEGNAVGLAMGYHMATGKVAVVYMQNSGLGNAVNPLTSLTDPEVYKIPMLFIVGWRGEPGYKDEPQHIKQGRVTLAQLDILDIPYLILEAKSDINTILDATFTKISERNAPVALVVRKDTFADYRPKSNGTILEKSTFEREAALDEILHLCSEDDLIITTTGKTSREIFELRVKYGQNQSDFLTVGGMGHTSSIALGLSIGQPNRRIVCIDGDGSLIMHMGSLPVIAKCRPQKFIHILLNNGTHESVGGQATSASVIKFSQLSPAVGYAGYAFAESPTELQNAWRSLDNTIGPVLLEIKIKNGSRSDLGRPTSTAEQNKLAFMKGIRA
jgi:phosphonopyruvate decarboxylase